MIHHQFDLKPFNTFGLEAKAKTFASFDSLEALTALLNHPEIKTQEKLILGGGSNMLLVNDFEGAVLKNEIMGISIEQEDESHVWVKCGAGEVWHHLVLWCLDKNYGGLENLSLIPGSVGAAPMQNIGAYGVEIKDTFHELEAWLTEEKQLKIFKNQDCQFGYRESIFKHELKNKAVILSVTFKLTKQNHSLHVDYGAIKSQLETMGVQAPTIRNVSDAVIQIRQSKLPNPAEIGNAGSFFKNPTVSVGHFNSLKSTYSDIVGYAVDGGVKLAAGWLIEHMGYKGLTINQTHGVHKKQALVLVNYGGATGKEIYDLSEKILNEVELRFGVRLEREVNMIGL